MNISRSLLLYITAAAVLFLLLFTPKHASAAEVSLPDTIAVVNQELLLPVQSSDLTGLGVVSFDCTLRYDEAKLDYLGHVSANTLSSSFMIVENTTEPGRLIISGAGTTPVSGAGPLIYFRFSTKNDTGYSELTFQNFAFNENTVPSTRVNGSVLIFSSYSDIPLRITAIPDTVITAGDNFVYQSSTVYDYHDSLTFTLAAAPQGMTIQSETGLVQWTPALSDTGTHTIEVGVSDNAGHSDTEVFTLIVLPDAPVSVHEPDSRGTLNVPDISLYPNPFNSTVTVRFDLNTRRNVKVEIYNLQGRKIRMLVNDVLGNGSYTAEWDGFSDTGRYVSSGMYICRITVGSASRNFRITYLK
ncbi:putative Ig domain-containing protein [candidate division KSB1 bacterium]